MLSHKLPWWLPLALALTACRQDMHDQPRYKPLAGTDFFGDGRSARPEIDGTVARGHLRTDTARFTGKVDGQDIDAFPFPITKDDLARGQQRFNIYCSPCHGAVGDGNGVVKKYGMGAVPTYHDDRLRKMADGEIFNTITNGKGQMNPYADKLKAPDRWAVIAYVRALQRAQTGTAADVPEDHKAELGLK